LLSALGAITLAQMIPRGQEHVMADELVVSTEPSGGPDTDEDDAGVPVDADLLVEEVSIDGMCGVY
jgi:mycofactocin precursor